MPKPLTVRPDYSPLAVKRGNCLGKTPSWTAKICPWTACPTLIAVAPCGCTLWATRGVLCAPCNAARSLVNIRALADANPDPKRPHLEAFVFQSAMRWTGYDQAREIVPAKGA